MKGEAAAAAAASTDTSETKAAVMKTHQSDDESNDDVNNNADKGRFLNDHTAVEYNAHSASSSSESCDLFGFHLPCFDGFRYPKWALAILCAAAAVQSFVCLGLINVVISTLEKRFRLPSVDSGAIASAYPLGQVGRQLIHIIYQ